MTELTAREWKILAIGFIGALIAPLFWLTRAPLDILRVLFHEIGHAVVAWLLGHPAIPAFDFMFGGGLTHWGEFHLPIALAVAAAFAYLAWRVRANMAALMVIVVLFVLWLIVVSSEWRRETVIASAGVVFEMLLAATFMYMVLADVGWHIPQIERPLGALIAFYVQFHCWTFALRLQRDPEFLANYQLGKGGGALLADLDIVALNLRIHGINASIPGIAKVLFLFSFVPMSVAVWCALQRDKIEELIDSLITEPS